MTNVDPHEIVRHYQSETGRATETQGLTHREQLAYKAGELAGREAERLGVSATETAWMVRMPTNITSGDVLITEDGRWVRRDGEWLRDDSDLDRPSSATEQDGLPDANRVGGYSAYGEPYAEDAYDGATETQDGHGDGSDCTNACHDERCIRGHGHFPGSDHTDGVNNWPLPSATETQDGERTVSPEGGHTTVEPGRPGEGSGRGTPAPQPPSMADVPAPAPLTETQDGERCPNGHYKTRTATGDCWVCGARFTPTPDDRDRETAWLIERGQSMGQVPTVWYSGEDYGEQWTTDANRALRYPSKEAAEAEIDLRSGHPIPSHGGPEGSRFGVAVEHGWIATPTPDDRDREVERIAALEDALRLTHQALRDRERKAGKTIASDVALYAHATLEGLRMEPGLAARIAGLRASGRG